MNRETLSDAINRPQELRTNQAEVGIRLISIRHGQATYQTEKNYFSLEGTLKPEAYHRLELAAAEIIEYLQTNNIQEISLIHSPKNRCIQTADIIIRALNQQGIRVSRFVDDRLRDEGIILNPNSRHWSEETFPEMIERTKLALDEIFSTDQVALIVTHEEIMETITHLLKINLFGPKNGEVWYFEPIS